MERVASVGSFCVSIIFRDMVATARYHDGSTMVSDCIVALASAKLQSDTVFHSARRIRGHAGRRRGGVYRCSLYCSFSPNDLINGANNFFSSCTRAV